MHGILKVALSATALVGSGFFAAAWSSPLYSGFYQVSDEPLGRSFSGVAAHALIPVDQLAKSPAGAQQYTILSKAGPHGHSAVWRLADGAIMSRDSLNLRGQVFELEQATHLGADGIVDRVVVRGFTPNGDAAETFTVANGQATWKSQVDSGAAPYTTPAEYVTAGGSFEGIAILIEALLNRPDKSLALLPSGHASAERISQIEVGEGPAKKTIVCWAITGLGNSPIPVWTTTDNKFFGAYFGLALLPVGYEGALDAIVKAQTDALAGRAPVIRNAVLKTPAGPVAFSHVRAFVDGKRFAEDQTVIVDRGKITKVGPAAAVAVPANAQVIDGKGETLVPGLWDSHHHFGDDFSGPFLLSLGITSARDPGNDDSLTLDRAKRRAAGQLLTPRIYPSSLIDGKGPYTAQVANVATSQTEAVALVDRAKANGFTGVKFYGTFNPAWVKAAAAEAHKLGLHVHGHLPAGMRTSQAIADGYDEITHIYFVMMEAMPDDVVKTSNGINRFDGIGRYARNVDLNAEPMKSLLATMAAKHIVSDPTLVVTEALYMPDNGDLSPAFAPYVGTLPPQTERNFRQGGFTPPQGLTRADVRQSFAKLLDLVRTMHKMGISIVAGTDGSGMELVRELELYVQAGFTNEEALEAATIVAAHNVHADKYTGSITAGKNADLVLVEGDPSHRIGDLRNTRLVMMDGKLMDADALRKAAGFSGRPITMPAR
ncbi:MAG TPA: amidohydrolase family protein [Rhizomicrobium sp.]|jgi:imidazolonepropionase-like amidohydrolase|nr:amidohydrolase family protein [Rhizomicrobium sp.]